MPHLAGTRLHALARAEHVLGRDARLPGDDEAPLAEQPAYIVDMGCGDGRLLRTLYEYVRERPE